MKSHFVLQRPTTFYGTCKLAEALVAQVIKHRQTCSCCISTQMFIIVISLVVRCTLIELVLMCIVSDEAMHGRVRSYRVVQPFPLLCVVVSARHLQHACMTHDFSTPTSRKQPKGICP